MDGLTRLNAAGEMVQSVWNNTAVHYSGVLTDVFVVMPNHIHGIIVLASEGAATDGAAIGDRSYKNVAAGTVGAGPRACPGEAGRDAALTQEQPQRRARTLSLPEIVHRFKTLTTKRYADGVKSLGWTPFPGRLWQRNYYEHIVRNDKSLQHLRQYIADNPARWHEDAENPTRCVAPNRIP